MDLDIQGRVALVCGSSSGLGFAIAERLAREGCKVAVNGRDRARVDAAVTKLRAAGADVTGVVADVRVAGDVTTLVSTVEQALGPIDILLTNAGGPPSKTFTEITADEWTAALELNLLSTVHLCRAVIDGMIQRGWGRIVCLTSVAARQPISGLILSTTARAGVHGFVKSLSAEVASQGVTVNAICPGYMRTDRVVHLFEAMAARERVSVADIEAKLLTEIPARRIGDPAELGAAVAFLVSAHAAYVTGTALQVDGGYIKGID